MKTFFAVLRRIILFVGAIMVMLSFCIKDDELSLQTAMLAFVILFFGGFALVVLSFLMGIGNDDIDSEDEDEEDDSK